VEGEKQDDSGEWTPCRRIYYSGRTGRNVFGKKTRYSIGMLEQTRNGWQRRETPVITSDRLSHCALAPKALFDGNRKRWCIWYLADAESVADERDASQIWYSESDDGITWEESRSFSGDEDKLAHTYVIRRSDGTCEMLLSKIPNISGKPACPEQKLWISTARTPSGNRADWSEPLEVIAASDGDNIWYANGFFGSSICEADAKGEEGEQYIFFASVHKSINWLTFAIKKLLAFEKPPKPAPFYFAIGYFKIR
jgi:hypothetical protein